MNKIVQDLLEFVRIEVAYTKYISIAFAMISSFFYFTIYPVISNIYFVGILSLISLDTLLGMAKALKTKNFHFSTMLRMSSMKVLEYAVYTAVAMKVGMAPLPLIGPGIALCLFSYMFIKEAASVLRLSSHVFSNPEMNNASNYVDDIAEGLFRHIQENKTDENPRQLPPSPGP